MSKEQLLEEFLAHIRTLSQSEKLKFIYQLRKNTQAYNRVYGPDCCCVLGAFAKSKGLKSIEDVKKVNNECTTTFALINHFKLPVSALPVCAVSGLGSWAWPAMTHLNDLHNVTFPQFITLIRSTMPRRHYFVCKNRDDGKFAYGHAHFSYLWHPGTGDKAYCHMFDGTDVLCPTAQDLEYCRHYYKEVTKSQAYAFHKRMKRKYK